MNSANPNPRWLNMLVLAGAGFFIFALLFSAVLDPRIRVLHLLQALIYIAVIVLTRRSSALGFGAGFFIACLWNYTNLFVTNFIAAGISQLSLMVQTGVVKRPDLLIAVIAAGGHFVLIGACLVGFLRTSPTRREWGGFVVGGVVAVLYFVAIIVTTGPQYIGLLKRVFSLP